MMSGTVPGNWYGVTLSTVDRDRSMTMEKSDELLADVRSAMRTVRASCAAPWALDGEIETAVETLHDAVAALDRHLSAGGRLPLAWAFATAD